MIDIDSSIEGSLSLLVNLNSESYSTFVQEDIFLGPSISGFSIVGGMGNDNIFSMIIVILFFIFAYFIFRRILSHKKVLKGKKVKKKKMGMKKRTFFYFKSKEK